MPIQRLLASLDRRLAAFRDGEPAPVLDPGSLTEAAELWRTASDDAGGVPVEVVRVIGWLHWGRYLAGPDDQDEKDLSVALGLFAPLVDLAPDAVPADVRRHLTDGDDLAHARQAHQAFAMLQRGMRSGDQVLLDEAIALLRATDRLARSDDSARMSSLSAALISRFNRTGNMPDLNDAIRMGRRAVEATSRTSPQYAGRLSNLAVGLRTRFGYTGDTADLDEAIDTGLIAVGAVPDDHPHRAPTLSNLGAALLSRHERTGNLSDLDEAINIGRKATTDPAAEDPDAPGRMSNLSLALQHRFERTGNLPDLGEAIDVGRRAAAAAPKGHLDRGACLSSLGRAMQLQFERSGNIDDLSEAIKVGRQAIVSVPGEHPDNAIYLTSLAVALRDRFECTGNFADLEEAIDVTRRAADATSTDLAHSQMYAANLAAALLMRFERTGSRDDLEEAICTGRRVADTTPADHPDLAPMLSNLSVALRSRFEYEESLDDLNQAIDIGRQAVTATPDDHPERAGRLSNLGTGLWRRFQATGTEADADNAVDCWSQAVDTSPTDHPDHARYLANLGVALWQRYERRKDVVDLERATGCLAQACDTNSAPANVRLYAARYRAEAVAQTRGAADALGAYEEAVELLPLLVVRGLDRLDQLHLLQQFAASLARDAAAAAIAAEKSERAIELLELGRGVLWSQMLDTRGELAALEQAAPHLATQLRACRAVLDRPSTVHIASAQVSRGTNRHGTEARMRAGRKFDQLVNTIRQLRPTPTFPHPARFLRPPSINELLPRHREAAVVVVNVSRWRCDALLLTSDGIRVVELTRLTGLTEEEVIDQTTLYLDALHEFEARTGPAEPLMLEMAITTTLEWLWTKVAAPILDHLGHRKPPSGAWPRLWWCPTGLLTLLPLHAAGHHGRDETVCDRVVSSYIPALRGVPHSQGHDASCNPPRMLVISLRNTPDRGVLPGAIAERDMLRGKLAPERFTELSDAAATRGRILSELGRHRWLHAACHGDQNLLMPTSGGLLPHDWPNGLVTVADITGHSLSQGEFAFLSACKSATGGVANDDEAITIAAAMHYSGWRHVIGTLWSIWDTSADSIAQDVYDSLIRDGILDSAHAATALHQAVRNLRDKHRGRPSLWAPFIHIGP